MYADQWVCVDVNCQSRCSVIVFWSRHIDLQFTISSCWLQHSTHSW